MRTLDIDTADSACWVYVPGSDAGPFGAHKNSWRGQIRKVPLGPQAIEVLRPFLKPDDPTCYLFRPCDGRAEVDARRRALRRTKIQPSQAARKRKAKPRRAPGQLYTHRSYPRSVARACEQAGVKFHPYMLRHGRKMLIERELGSEAARCVLGQKSINATQHYGRLDTDRAAAVMAKIG
jgi:hypothetical protein